MIDSGLRFTVSTKSDKNTVSLGVRSLWETETTSREARIVSALCERLVSSLWRLDLPPLGRQRINISATPKKIASLGREFHANSYIFRRFRRLQDFDFLIINTIDNN